MDWKKRLEYKGTPLIEKEVRKAFVDKLQLVNSKKPKVLSVSTGFGMWDYLCLKNLAGASVVATDIVTNPLRGKAEVEMKKNGSWKYVKVKADEKLPFKAGEFDLVYHMDVVEHVEKPYLFLKEHYRVLKKGGMLIVGTPNLLRIGNIVKMFMGRLSFPANLGGMEELGDCVHQQEFNEWNLKLLMQETGFKEISSDVVCFGLLKPDWVADKKPKSGLKRIMGHFLLAVGYK